MGKEAKLKAVEKPEEPLTLPSQLDPSDLAYQQHLISTIKMEQRAHQHQLQTWTTYLAARYALGPQDRVEESGRIIRVPAGSGGS